MSKFASQKRYGITSSGTIVVPLTNNENGEDVKDAMYVRVESDANLTVKGFADEQDSGIALKCVNDATLEVADSITTAGEYMFCVGGFYKAEITVSGTTGIVVRTTY